MGSPIVSLSDSSNDSSSCSIGNDVVFVCVVLFLFFIYLYDVVVDVEDDDEDDVYEVDWICRLFGLVENEMDDVESPLVLWLALLVEVVHLVETCDDVLVLIDNWLLCDEYSEFCIVYGEINIEILELSTNIHLMPLTISLSFSSFELYVG